MLLTIPLTIAAIVLAWVIRPKEKLVGPTRLAIPATIIPPCLTLLLAIASQLLGNATGMAGVSGLANTFFVAALGMVGIALLVLVVFALKRKGKVTKAIGFGICIDFIACVLVFGLLEWLAGV